jgi:hypothetical protein
MEESPHESLNAVLDFIHNGNSCIFDLLMFLIKNISKTATLITIHCCKFS